MIEKSKDTSILSFTANSSRYICSPRSLEFLIMRYANHAIRHASLRGSITKSDPMRMKLNVKTIFKENSKSRVKKRTYTELYIILNWVNDRNN